MNENPNLQELISGTCATSIHECLNFHVYSSKNLGTRCRYNSEWFQNLVPITNPVVIAEKHTNYFQFLLKMKEEVPSLTNYEEKVLTMFSLEVLNGKRIHEIVLLVQLLRQEKITYDDYLKQLFINGCRTDEAGQLIR